MKGRSLTKMVLFDRYITPLSNIEQSHTESSSPAKQADRPGQLLQIIISTHQATPVNQPLAGQTCLAAEVPALTICVAE